MSLCLVASSIAFYNIPIAPPQITKSAAKLADFSLIKAEAVGFGIRHQQNRDGVIRTKGIEINTIRTVAILGLEIPMSEVGINDIEMGMITGTGISRSRSAAIKGNLIDVSQQFNASRWFGGKLFRTVIQNRRN